VHHPAAEQHIDYHRICNRHGAINNISCLLAPSHHQSACAPGCSAAASPALAAAAAAAPPSATCAAASPMLVCVTAVVRGLTYKTMVVVYSKALPLRRRRQLPLYGAAVKASPAGQLQAERRCRSPRCPPDWSLYWAFCVFPAL